MAVKKKHKKQNTMGIFSGIINQSGETPPTVNENQNTIGAITWARDSTGLYIGTCVGAFNPSTTEIYLGQIWGIFEANVIDNDKIYVGSKELVTGFPYGDDILINMPIRIYTQ